MKHALLPNAPYEASVVSLRHRYVLVVNSKTAGTTLKTVAAKLEGEWLAARDGRSGDDPGQRAENWFWTPSLADLNDRWLREVFLGGSFFRFTTVRHPAARCWSAWIDKVVRRHPEFVTLFGGERWFPDELSNAQDLVKSFEVFVDALHMEPGLLGADRHWAPQHLVLQWGAFPYDFVGKTENFGDVIRRWEAATGLAIQSCASETGRRNTNALALPGSLLSEATWHRLTRLYEVDADAFEYSMEQDDWAVEREWECLAERLLQSRRELVRRSNSLLSPAWHWLRVDSARRCRSTAARMRRSL
jgi:hypothetical protein